MKVLMYSANSGAAPENELYEGLKRTIGDKNVVLYKPKVYGTATQRTLPEGAMGDGELRGRLDEFDAVLFFYSAFPDKDFEYVLNKRTGITKMYVDGNDDFFVRRIYNHPEIKYYLKRELFKDPLGLPYLLTWGSWYLYQMAHISPKINYRWIFTKWAMLSGIASGGRHKKLRPFPLMIVPREAKGKVRKTYDVSFMGHINSLERIRYVKAAERISAELGLKAYLSRDYLNPKPALPWKDYLRILRSSKAGLSLRGFGYDTYRYWEIPCYGSMLMSQRMPIVIPNDFVEGESALFFSDKAELRRKIERYILKSDEWREIARNGQRHFFRHHTPERRAESLLRMIKE